MTDLNTAPCAREGCGAPKEWHTTQSTIEELRTAFEGHRLPRRPWYRIDGHCIGEDCLCTAYLAPEPPKPKRTAYVVEMMWPTLPETVRVAYQHPGEERHDAAIVAAPLAEYLTGRTIRCEYCRGLGEVTIGTCAHCGGLGFTMREEALR